MNSPEISGGWSPGPSPPRASADASLSAEHVRLGSPVVPIHQDVCEYIHIYSIDME